MELGQVLAVVALAGARWVIGLALLLLFACRLVQPGWLRAGAGLLLAEMLLFYSSGDVAAGLWAAAVCARARVSCW